MSLSRYFRVKHHLTSKGKRGKVEFDRQNRLVDGFEKARAQTSVNFDGASDDSAGLRILFAGLIISLWAL